MATKRSRKKAKRDIVGDLLDIVCVCCCGNMEYAKNPQNDFRRKRLRTAWRNTPNEFTLLRLYPLTERKDYL